MRITTIIAVDVASAAKNTALALGVLEHRDDPVLRLCEVRSGSRQESPAAIAGRWLLGAPGPVLLALDAPLGWPATMTTALAEHVAGQPLPGTANDLFRRRTDVLIHQRLGKLPLDVGADRIARTAFAALALLAELRGHGEWALPVTVDPAVETGAVEVYPGGLLRALGLRSSGYKGAQDRELRRELLRALPERVGYELRLPAAVVEAAIASDHVLDAVLAAVAGADCRLGLAVPPVDVALARREGWIWSRPPVD